MKTLKRISHISAVLAVIYGGLQATAGVMMDRKLDHVAVDVADAPFDLVVPGLELQLKGGDLCTLLAERTTPIGELEALLFPFAERRAENLRRQFSFSLPADVRCGKNWTTILVHHR